MEALGIYGIEINVHPAFEIRIYGPEKTIGDLLFRYRRRLGEDLALEGLKEYLTRRDSNIPWLLGYDAICQAKAVIHPNLKAVVT